MDLDESKALSEHIVVECQPVVLMVPTNLFRGSLAWKMVSTRKSKGTKNTELRTWIFESMWIYELLQPVCGNATE